MRIAILTSVYSLEYGVSRVIRAQIPFLLQAGFQVDVYAHETHGAIKIPGVRLIRVPTHLRGLQWALDFGRYDVVIAHTHTFFHLLPRLRHVGATLIYDHGLPPADWFQGRDRDSRLEMLKDLVSSIYPAVTQVITISQFAAKYIGWDKALVIYNGADHFENIACSVHVRPVSDPIRILAVSRFGIEEQRYKGIDDLCRIAKDLGAGYEVVLVGKGAASEKARLEAAGLTVLMDLDDQELAEQYSRCDAVVSFSKWELFNLPLGEAGFFQKPALALDLGPHREVTPFVFSDYESLCAYVKKSDKDSLRYDGEKMFEFVQSKFCWAQNGGLLVAQVRDMVKMSHPPRQASPIFWLFVQFWNVRECLRQIARRKWTRA